MKIELKCALCGGNNFEFGGAQSDECSVACGDCNHVIGTLGELKLKLAEEVIRRSGPRETSMAAEK